MIPALGPATYRVEVRRKLVVPMRDGVPLIGDLYLPVRPAGTTEPTVVIRSPYGRRGLGGALVLAKRGMPVFIESCRGTFGSGGVFTPQIHEQADGEDTLRWVRRQPWFTGRLATHGPSYLGYVQWAVAGHLERTDPAVAPDALCLQVTMPDFGAITWDNGAFSLRNALGWSRMMAGIQRPWGMIRQFLPSPALTRGLNHLPLDEGDGVAAGHTVHWYQDWLKHDLTDQYWVRQSHAASVGDVTVPTSMIAGWYDIFLPWQLRTYATLAAAGNPPWLTVGPWGHMSRGLNETTMAEVVDFLGHRLMGRATTRAHPVLVFVTGAEEWRGYETWPPPGVSATQLHLQPGGGLAATPAPPGKPTRYVYDPADPTPAVGGPALSPRCGPVDNRAHERRGDVVTFDSQVLAEPLEVLGEPSATIALRSDRPTTDLFVRLCDVHPDGRVMTVCDGIRRVGGAHTAALDPEPDADGVRDVVVTLWPTAHRFERGHRVHLQVSSGAHPRYSRNTGGGEPVATARIPHVANQEILHDPSHASRLTLPVLERG
jgi:uncharacterized protein